MNIKKLVGGLLSIAGLMVVDVYFNSVMALVPQAERHRISTGGHSGQYGYRQSTASSHYYVPNKYYAGAARHPDVMDIWVLTASGDARDLRQRAVDACNAVMGGGCDDGGWWTDATMTVLRTASGGLYFAGGWDPSESRRVHELCNSQQPLPCEVVGKYNNYRNHTPVRSAHKHYAAVARIDGKDYGDKLYIASGFTSLHAAQSAAMVKCQQASGSKPCGMGVWVANGVLHIYQSQSHFSSMVESSPQRAEQAMKQYCITQQFKNCQTQAQYDSRQPGIFVHDYLTLLKD
ncbi:DUF4189 domain-containing protein [Acinetobacter suaedae]|uniref:DUF4189 domain-containing protein n=1 Tax=Acinetobacter suaedae TaxID=2609668 RepID=A0A5P1UW42_9GAMM|nr:DUF4189 domain-containing protein [Acinetobacter sp. C16S1]QER40030.1 DUF4189 domain-containing protein [Acinetobacter sp. C16S1]